MKSKNINIRVERVARKNHCEAEGWRGDLVENVWQEAAAPDPGDRKGGSLR